MTSTTSSTTVWRGRCGENNQRAVTDVTEWPHWTASITSVRLLDGPLALGGRVVVDQPRLGNATWTVVEFIEGTTFTWRSSRGGVTTEGGHHLRGLDGGHTELRLTIETHGMVAPLAMRMLGTRVRRYVDMEADGLARFAEYTTAP